MAELAQNPQPKILSGFAYKTVLVVALIAILPFFPTQAPDFVSQSVLTRGWELIHLLFVGIAISYGLFSRRNADPELAGEAAAKADSPQSYVYKMLQVSSVFDDDEPDTPAAFPDDGKVQTWSSQYQRGKPVVVVEKERSDLGDSDGPRVGKPLFLPVRSLKSHPQDFEAIDSCDEDDGFSVHDNGSRLISRNMDEIDRRGSDGIGALETEGDLKESVVLPSPIPWKSRSGRMELKDSVMDTDPDPAKTLSFRRSSDRAAPSPKRLSPSPEMRAKSSEDPGKKKKSYYKCSPPPPPPPPPPPIGHGSQHFSDKRDARSFKDELRDVSRRGRSSIQSDDVDVVDMGIDNLGSRSPLVARSVRTVRWKDTDDTVMEKAAPDESLQGFSTAIRKPPPPALPPKYEIEKRNEDMEKVMVDSDDSETDSDGESSDVEDASSPVVEVVQDENEVDKKADEFIAKFREQIRLQRIESIKRSGGHRGARSAK